MGKAHSVMGWEMLKEKTREGKEKATGVLEKALEGVQERTGLKVREAMGWGKKREEGVVDLVKEKVEKVKEIVKSEDK